MALSGGYTPPGDETQISITPAHHKHHQQQLPVTGLDLLSVVVAGVTLLAAGLKVRPRTR
jgi:hypothetical protein